MFLLLFLEQHSIADAKGKSTFFGGHDDKYATPKDQYVWFKELSLTINV
jgi:hypothetical protein